MFFVSIVLFLYLVTCHQSKGESSGLNFGPDYHIQTREIHSHSSGRIIIIPDKFDESGHGDVASGVYVNIDLKPGELAEIEGDRIEVGVIRSSLITNLMRSAVIVLLFANLMRRNRTGNTP